MKTIKTTAITAAAIATILAVFGLGLLSLGIFGVDTYNQAQTLKTTYEAKVDANKTDFDNMIKVISQTSQVSKAQLEKLKDIYTSYAEARSGEGASKAIMNWVQESVPNVDTTTMNNLQNIIVSTRNGWTERQKELVDISREYNTLLARFPTNIFLGWFRFQKIDPNIVTSKNTEESFKSGEDNSYKLDL